MSVYLPKIEDYIIDQESFQHVEPSRPSPKKKKKRTRAALHRLYLQRHDEPANDDDDDEVDDKLSKNNHHEQERDAYNEEGVPRKGGNNKQHLHLPDIWLSNGHAQKHLQNGHAQKHSAHSPDSPSPPHSASPSLVADHNNNHPDVSGGDPESHTAQRKPRVAFYHDDEQESKDRDLHLLGLADDEDEDVHGVSYGGLALGDSFGAPGLSPRDGYGPSPRDGGLSPRDAGQSPRDGSDQSGTGVSPRDAAGRQSIFGKRLRLKRTASRFLDKAGLGAAQGADSRVGRLVTRTQIRRKFAQAIKAVISIRKLAAIMIKKSEEPSAMLKTFTDIIDMSDNFSENLKTRGLSFDPSYFKANKEISISSEVKNILTMSPAERTADQIQTAMYGLQSLPSFAEYPLHMQEKLAKVAWYEVVPPKRTIIRQGHYAENFYFILSGQAVVTILIRDPKTNESHVRTANFMRKGTSFGELALLHHSRRTATVTSQDTVQLLTIKREDFFDIFMATHGSDDVPEHIKFISQLDFMKGWPLERLLEHPQHCLLHFFKPNMVIVKDSRQSDWLYIVKSGSCQILKQLRSVTAKLGFRKHEATLDESHHLPHTGTAVRGPKVDTGLHRPRPKSHRPGLDVEPSSSSNEEPSSTTGGTGRGGKQSTRNPGLLQLPPLLSKASSSSSSSPRSRKFSKEIYSHTPHTGTAHLEAKSSSPSRVARLAGPRKQRRPSFLSPTPHPSPRRDVKRHVTIQPSAPPPPVFVQVSRLKPRDIFGLELVRFHDDPDAIQTSVSLVSRGAECIMLSKDFFRKHATDMVKKNLQDIVRPYPDEATFQESLQRKADWELFKHTLIEDITSVTVS